MEEARGSGIVEQEGEVEWMSTGKGRRLEEGKGRRVDVTVGVKWTAFSLWRPKTPHTSSGPGNMQPKMHCSRP